jgi:RHS repeat-associated protein
MRLLHRFNKFFITLAFLLVAAVVSAEWDDNHRVGNLSGIYQFNYTQTPDDLIPLISPVVGGSTTGLTYQWEQSSKPLEGFSVITGATGSGYSFPAALTQTMYYRRKTTDASSESIYSNTVRIEVVSINWEDHSYVRQHTILKPGVTDWTVIDNLSIGDKLESTTFYDGLGRVVQSNYRETATPTANNPWSDIVQFTVYDQFGRKTKSYLPYTTLSESGKYKIAAEADQTAYYVGNYNETSAYSEVTLYDNSPLNRAKMIKSPGTSWAAGNGNSMQYEVNTSADAVRRFRIDYNAFFLTPSMQGIYSEGTLYKSISIDENLKQVIEYINTTGQVVLKKVQLDDSPTDAYTGWISTYNVYDEFGRLRCVIPPEAVIWLYNNNWSFIDPATQVVSDVIQKLCFFYEYDEKGRTIAKRAPGAKQLLMLYDKRDRMVFTQDGNQRSKYSPSANQEWTATIYDELDRPVISTLYKTAKTVTTLQSDINSAGSTSITTNNVSTPLVDLLVENRVSTVNRYAASHSIEFVATSSAGFEYTGSDEFVAEIDPAAQRTGSSVTNNPYNNSISEADLNNSAISTILKYQFYDSYNFAGVRSFDNEFANTQAYATNGTTIAAVSTTARTTSFVTGSMVRVLGTSTFLHSTEYYDEDGQHIQTTEENIKGGKDVTTYQYHWDGRLLSTHSKHTTVATGYSNYSILTKHEHDKIGRLKSIAKKYGSNAFKTIATYELDDMGRLKTKRLDPGYTGSGKNELEKLEYSYNIHNNITGINKNYAQKASGYSKWDNFFGFYLGYDNRDNVFSAAQLDGHVAGQLWNSQGDDEQRKYDYEYDNAGRLTKAIFNEGKTSTNTWSNAKMDFSVMGRNGKIEYDLNGNVKYMLQRGIMPGSSSPVNVDDLEYTYEEFSNRLIKVADNGTAGANNGKFGDFKDGSNSTADDYVYDDNGNVVIDLNKNVKDLANVTGANGIRYNYLDKPEEINIPNKGTIQIVYDAEGNRLQTRFKPYNKPNYRTTTYINQFVYEEANPSNVELQYINFEEGRIRVIEAVSAGNGYDGLAIDGNLTLENGKKGAWDYYLRDYQQNVRMILTEETHYSIGQCTMEDNRMWDEQRVFGNEVNQKFDVANIPGQSTGNGWQRGDIGEKVSRLGKLAASTFGPNVLMKVMAGDEIAATSLYYYKSAATNSSGNSQLASTVLQALLGAIGGSSSANNLYKGTTAAGGITSQLNAGTGATSFTSMAAPNANNATGTSPKANLTVLFFDERFNFVAEGSMSDRVSQANSSNVSVNIPATKAPKNGYAFVYLSNESDEHVYFDNLKVSHNRGHIIEENHYYAYGLKIAAISSTKLPEGGSYEGHLKNNNLYQGEFSEYNDDTQWNDFQLRNYDPQIGRWVQQDPYQQFVSPYSGMGNDPVNGVDEDGGWFGPAGMLAGGVIGGIIGGMASDGDGAGAILKDVATGMGIGIATAVGLGPLINVAPKGVAGIGSGISPQISLPVLENNKGGNPINVEVGSTIPIDAFGEKGELTIFSFESFEDADGGGVYVEFHYTSTNNKLAKPRYIQTFKTNAKVYSTTSELQHSIDPDPTDPRATVDDRPFYWNIPGGEEFTENSKVSCDARVWDRPRRNTRSYNVFWQAEISLVAADPKTGQYNSLINFKYGFELKSNGTVIPKPLRISQPSAFQRAYVAQAKLNFFEKLVAYIKSIF